MGRWNSRDHLSGVFQVALDRVGKGCCWRPIVIRPAKKRKRIIARHLFVLVHQFVWLQCDLPSEPCLKLLRCLFDLQAAVPPAQPQERRLPVTSHPSCLCPAARACCRQGWLAAAPAAGMLVVSAAQGVHSRRDCGKIAFEIPILVHCCCATVTIATMPAFTAAGRLSQAATTRARSSPAHNPTTVGFLLCLPEGVNRRHVL
jgi:hypothetical protein